MDETKLRQETVDFLNAHRKAVFATIGSDNKPTTLLMLYAIDDNFNVYFGTKLSPEKRELFTKNPFISISVVQESVDPLKTVEIRGEMEIVSLDKTKETLEFFELKNPSKLFVKDAPDFAFIKIKPSSVRLLDATSGKLVVGNILGGK